MRTRNISDIQTVTTYTTNTNAILEITSVASMMSVAFPAFLTDFSQTFDAQWNTEDVFGRADPIATYQSTKRTISLGFDIIAGTQEGAKSNLEQCRSLVRMVYPVYKRTVLSKAPLVRVNFANLIVGAQKAAGYNTGGQEIEAVKGKVEITGTSGVTKRKGVDIRGDRIAGSERQIGNNTIAVDTEQNFEATETQGSPGTSSPGARAPSVNNSYVGLLGWISGLSWKPNLEMGMFTENKLFYPKVIAISFTFNVLHEHTPSQGDNTTSFPFRTKK